MKNFLRSAIPVALLLFASTSMAQGERIYIMNAPGYNMADPPLITAIESLGHTVDVSALGAIELPEAFTSACVDPEHGYHWLCFFGSQDQTALIPQVQDFINAGGKVLLQYEVSCCVTASQNAAEMASAFTGLTITPNIADYISLAGGLPGWEAHGSTGCLNLTGAAYKCMDGIPPGNALNATGDLNNAQPSFTTCTNFGFAFGPDDLPEESGGVLGLGDVNLYYFDAGEPPNNGGMDPVDMVAVDLIFGSATSKCTLLPTGCLSTGVKEPPPDFIGQVFPNPANDHLIVERTNSAPMDLRIYNAVGQLMISMRTQDAALITIPTASLPIGAYRLLLRDRDRQEVVPFLVEH